MTDITPNVVNSTAHRLLFRLSIWFIGAVIIFGISEWIHTAYWVPVSTDAAMHQMEDSDAAFVQMQTVEQVKNSFSTVSILLVVLWTILVLFDYVIRSYFRISKLVKERMKEGA